MSYTPAAQYGDKAQLSRAGLATKEAPITGTQRMVLPAGRPANSSAAPMPQAPAPTGPSPAEVALMQKYAEDEKAYQGAAQAASLPGASQGTQFLAQLADMARMQSAYQLHSGTPHYALTEG